MTEMTSNLKKMNSRDLYEIRGGGFWFAVGIGAAIAAAREVLGDWAGFKAGINGDPPPAH